MIAIRVLSEGDSESCSNCGKAHLLVNSAPFSVEGSRWDVLCETCARLLSPHMGALVSLDEAVRVYGHFAEGIKTKGRDWMARDAASTLTEAIQKLHYAPMEECEMSSS